jgi:arginine exporter protein ArgO
VWGGWVLLLIAAVFGGNLGIKGNMPIAEMVTAWGSVSLLWMAVFHGGHTAKEVFSASKWGKAQ